MRISHIVLRGLSFIRPLSLILIGSFPGLCRAATVSSSVTGEFLFRSGGTFGGITGVDASGTTYFGILPNGFSTTEYNGLGNNVHEFTQGRTGGRIAFSSERNPNDSARIYVINGDGTGLRQVTFHDPNAPPSGGIAARDHSRPAISPDGSKIAYLNGETYPPDPTFDQTGDNCAGNTGVGLWVVNADGSNPHLMVSPDWAGSSHCNAGGVSEVAWSPDGTKLLVRDNTPRCFHEVFIINADGSGAEQLTCWASGTTQPGTGLDWSPDGTKVVWHDGNGGADPFVVSDVSGSRLASIPNSYGANAVRFSPDSSLLAFAGRLTNGHTGIVITDLSGDPLSNIDTYNNATGELNGDAGTLVWAAGSPGTLGSMALGVPSVYVNSCPNYTVWLQPSVYNTAGALVTHGFTGNNVAINSGDGDSWLIDGFGFASFAPTRNSGTGTLQLTNMGVSSNTVPLTTDQNCTCQSNMAPSFSIVRGGLRYVAGSQQQFVQSLTVKNNTTSPVTGPINIVVENLTGTATLTNLSGNSGCAASGSPYMTVVPSGSSLGAGASSSVTLYFRNPSLKGFTYSTAITGGAGAP